MSDEWKQKFRELYEAAQQRYRNGRTTTTTLFEPDEVYFLATIGCSSRELFDFIEDSINWGDVEYEQVEGVDNLGRASGPDERMREMRSPKRKQKQKQKQNGNTHPRESSRAGLAYGLKPMGTW